MGSVDRRVLGRGLHRISAALLAVALVVSACAPDNGADESPGAATLSAAPGTPNPQPSGSRVAGADAGGWARIPAIVDELQPSVVSIIRSGAEGSGVVWSDDGIVVTNNHVVEGVSQVTVVFADATQSPAEVVATDPLSDLAIVRTERGDLPAAEFAGELPEVGELAIAMGNPLGFENSVTAGIVSGVHRSFPNAAQIAPALIDLIQTDAAISPGNSGGALVGGGGQVIGINVAYIPPQARAVAIGFAIPSTTVTDVVTELLEEGEVEHAALGVRLVELTPQIIERFDLAVSDGALVIAVLDGGPAAQAGIQPGDIITGFDGEPVRTSEDLLAELRRHDPGDEVTLRIVRDAEEQEVTVDLAPLAALGS